MFVRMWLFFLYDCSIFPALTYFKILNGFVSNKKAKFAASRIRSNAGVRLPNVDNWRGKCFVGSVLVGRPFLFSI